MVTQAGKYGQSSNPPQVQHNFDGDVKILNATLDRRTEIRKALTSLQQDLQKMENLPTQIKADIKLRVGGSGPKEHVYSVSITSSDFNPDEYARLITTSDDNAPKAAPHAGQDTPLSPLGANHVNRQQATPTQLTPRPESRRLDGDDDVVEIRPYKRPRTDGEPASPSSMQDKDTDALLRQTLALLKQDGSGRADELLAFMKDWHMEWVRQGGWLFDNVSKANTTSAATKTGLERKLDSVQDVLGQSMNAASASTMSELANVTKLIPWLEECRKSSADKVQAREEKWRSSSATFHDQTRREREAAEKRLEKKLEEQKELLLKLVRASGIHADETEAPEGGTPERSREESLGAQLTAELNMEAEKSGEGANAEHETIDIDDDN